MREQVDKSKENKSRVFANSIIQKKSNVKQGFEFVDNGPEAAAQRVLQCMMNNHATQCQAPIQRQKIAGYDVYVDAANYPYWKSKNFTWHMTMKSETRWHITKSDRSDSYWFEVDGGFKGGVDPTFKEYGKQKAKHHNLTDAPDQQFEFIRDHYQEIMKVTDKE